MKTIFFILLFLSFFNIFRSFSQAVLYHGEEITLSDKIMPVTADNLFRDPDYYHWCSSVIRGEDGNYHLFYSRWEKSKAFTAWLTHSKIAHAVSESPAGPYRYVNTVIDFDRDFHGKGDLITAHNPKIKYFNGRYYLYFISTFSDRKVTDSELSEIARTGYSHRDWHMLRVNQRTYVASSSSLSGEWKIRTKPLLEPGGPIETLVVNPAVAQGPDRRFYLIVKGDKPGSTEFLRNQAVAVSNHPDRGFALQPRPVIEDWDSEDMSIWYDAVSSRFYAVFHAHAYIGMMSSADGINWGRAADFTVMEKKIRQSGKKELIVPERLERPFVFFENGRPEVLSLAVGIKGDAYIVFIPLSFSH